MFTDIMIDIQKKFSTTCCASLLFFFFAELNGRRRDGWKINNRFIKNLPKYVQYSQQLYVKTRGVNAVQVGVR